MENREEKRICENCDDGKSLALCSECNRVAPEERVSLKKQISQILIKWDMPTRQVAINEIMELVSTRDARLVGEIEKWAYKYTNYMTAMQTKRSLERKYCVDEIKEDIIKIIKEEMK